MAGRHLAQGRRFLGAPRHGERAAGVEAAPRWRVDGRGDFPGQDDLLARDVRVVGQGRREERLGIGMLRTVEDRKSTRLNSSHSQISYAVFCLKKKNVD